MARSAEPAGELYIVATPIGNLGDITLRAIETLRQVEWVLAEDTRRTRNLLTHLGIGAKQVTRVDAHSSPKALEAVVQRIAEGRSAALVTDAGMPSVSDPGALLVCMARAAGVKVVPVPGASAVTAAIAVSGFLGGPFLFFGFLARKGKQRREQLDKITGTLDAVVLFESPHRMQATLLELAERAPERPVLVARELTKLNEELAHGTVAELAERTEWRGEITFVLGPLGAPVAAPVNEQQLETAISEGLQRGLAAKTIAAELGARFGLPRREVYERVLDAKTAGPLGHSSG